MKQEYEDHLNEIISRVTRDTCTKYRGGQKEHGGNLKGKPGMLAMAWDEVLDLITYVHTTRTQLEDLHIDMEMACGNPLQVDIVDFTRRLGEITGPSKE